MSTFVIAGGDQSPENVRSIVLLFRIDLVLLSITGLFVVAKLPQIIALFGTTSEWFDGHFLHHVPYSPSAARSYLPPNSEPKTDFTSNASHTFHSHNTLPSIRVAEKGTPAKIRYPPHVGSCIKFLRPVLSLLRLRTSPGFSIAQSLIFFIYLVCLGYATFYKSNIFTDGTRTAWVAIAQLPFLFLLAQKNNILGLLLGYGYEKLNFLHRFGGRLVVLAANIHALSHIYYYAIHGTLSQRIALYQNIWGLIALISLDLMCFFSTQYWRQRAYDTFLRIHIVGLFSVVLGSYMHRPSILPYTCGCIGIYAFDYLMRIIKSRITTAVLLPIPQLDSTRVEISNYNTGWRAGQHIRLRVLSMGLGWFGWTEVHPFTIASVSRGQEGIVLICKRKGTWTKSLFEIAKLGGSEYGDIGRKVKVVVEGPYGGPGHRVFSSFSAAVVVAGGSGITFALSVIQNLIQKDLNAESRVKTLELIWVIQDPASLTALLPNLTSLIEQSLYTPLRIRVFYTRVTSGKFPFGPETYFHHRLTLAPGHPQFSKVLDNAVSRAVELGSGAEDDGKLTGMVLAVCGPTGMADDVVKAVDGVEAIRRDQVGGIEIHEEVFGM